MTSGHEAAAGAGAETATAAEHVACLHEHGTDVAPVPLPPDAVLAAAGERIGIVLQLREGPRCVHELVDALGVTQPLVSQHLRVLKASHVVSARRRGREIHYELIDDHLLRIVEAAVGHAREE